MNGMPGIVEGCEQCEYHAKMRISASIDRISEKHKTEMEAERLVRIVRREQFDAEKGPPSIRRLAKLMRCRQAYVLELCEDNELNVNVGLQCGGGIYEFEAIGEYTIEDLSVNANA